MTTHDQLAARALKRATEDVQELADSPEARARTVAALQAAIEAAARPVAPPPARPWRLALAAGLALLLGAGLWFQAQPKSVGRILASSGVPGHRLLDAEVVESGPVALWLELARGVKVHLQPGSVVQLRDDGTRVVVRRGEVAAEVTSLDSPFFLESGDTVVATRGARLSLRPGAGCDGQAQVRVTEGTVRVNDGPPLQAGEDWPRCAPTTTLTPPPPPAPLAPVVAPAPELLKPAVSRRPAPPPPPAVKEEERLARQNELYLQALTLQRSGEVTAAVKKLELVLADPISPLADTALAQKMKWLTATDRAAARAAAREYLQRFPMGFGRADAETLVMEEP